MDRPSERLSLESPVRRRDCRVAVVIPCFRVRNSVLGVVRGVGSCVSAIYVVDDGCPEATGRHVEANTADPRVRVIHHERNQGVGGAVITGIEAALRDGMDVVVKVDGDGQMDPALIPLFIAPVIAEQADLAKGNRFYHLEDVKSMPAGRLLGNAVLSFFAKLSTGYWNIFDPTNGLLAVDARLLAELPLAKLQRRYFFETDLLFRSGLLHAKVIDIPMRAVYADERSNLKIRRELLFFIAGHVRNTGKRIFYNYILRDFNVASLELICGVLLTLFGVLFGLANWGTDEPATAGTVMIAALPILIGVILLISFVNYDAQQVPRQAISPRLAQRRIPAPVGEADA